MATAPDRLGVTGIGSLPHTDPDAAVEFVFEHGPGLPYLPQLVRFSPCEMMLAQLAASDAGALDASNGFAALAPFQAAMMRTGSPVAKVQIVGPVTATAAGIDRAQERIRALAGMLRDALTRPGLTIIVQLDEPLLNPGAGREEVRALASLVDRLRRESTVWIHCCGNLDWEAVSRSQPDGISFDLWSTAPPPDGFPWPPTVALGAVPTDLGRSTGECREAFRRWLTLIPQTERARTLLVTPSCGLGMRTMQQAIDVMDSCYSITSED